MAREEKATKSGYLNFDTYRMYMINWRSTGGSLSEYIREYRIYTSSYPMNKPTVSSTIPITEESCKRLTHTPRLGESHTTRRSKILSQPDRSYGNIYESSSMTSVEIIDTYKANSEDLHPHTEYRIIQVDESTKVSNFNSCQCLTEFKLDMVRAT